MKVGLLILALSASCWATTPPYVQGGKNDVSGTTASITCATVGGTGGCNTDITAGHPVIYMREPT